MCILYIESIIRFFVSVSETDLYSAEYLSEEVLILHSIQSNPESKADEAAH